ncbi:glycosyltransferase family 2 protein [Methyloversatilis sp. XJ19-13]|uniref:glycosyltransferase family 2 protein n=1 Tax=Methyloversatilis sp. XJ19-13 TaxID=2963430 RepID=UPI00211BA87D|nr:glycosyltransferase family 2 protein [Methyloversatilis sp. XJ19-13]
MATVVAASETTSTVSSVAVVVLNWNGKADTLACLASLRLVSPATPRIIVVDNGSVDDSVLAIRQAFPNVDLLPTGENLGFAEGNNVGIRHARSLGASHVLLLNNDTEVAPDLIEQLLAAHARHPQAGIIGPKTYYHADPKRIWWAGGRWDEAGQCFAQIGDGEIDQGQRDHEVATEFIVGSAMFVPSEVLEQVGLLDSRYFLNYEEIDLCTRVQRAGYSLVYAPQARIWHKVSASFGAEESPLKVYYTFRNRLLWARENLTWSRRLKIMRRMAAIVWNRLGRPLFQWRVLASRGLKPFFWQARDAFTSPINRAILCGIRDHARRRFGPCPPDVMALHQRWKAARD